MSSLHLHVNSIVCLFYSCIIPFIIVNLLFANFSFHRINLTPLSAAGQLFYSLLFFYQLEQTVQPFSTALLLPLLCSLVIHLLLFCILWQFMVIFWRILFEFINIQHLFAHRPSYLLNPHLY